MEAAEGSGYAEWASWRRHVFGDRHPGADDGPDPEGLVEAVRREPDVVAGMVRLGLEFADPAAAWAMHALADRELVPPRLVRSAQEFIWMSTGTFRVRLAQSLRAATGDDSWAMAIVSVATAIGATWSERIDALLALSGYRPTADLVAAVRTAVCDPEYLIRFHAANTLLRFAGDPMPVNNRPEVFARIVDSAAGQWAAAAAELGELALAGVEP